MFKLPLRSSTTSALKYHPLGKRIQIFYSTTTDAPEQLAGTAPAHRYYAFLHTLEPPSAYPAKYTTPVQRKLLAAAAPWGGSINFSWSPSQPVHPHTGSIDTGDAQTQTYRLTAFSSTRGKLEIDAVSLDNVEDVADALRAHAEPVPAGTVSQTLSEGDDIYLYVCTHGARDCRCGNTGGAVVRAIRDELDIRRQRSTSDPSTRIKLGEVSHVGGHKYAANVLVYPHGEWLGRMVPEKVPEMLDAILARQVRPMHDKDKPLCPSYWRGRMGLNKEEQIGHFNKFSDRY